MIGITHDVETYASSVGIENDWPLSIEYREAEFRFTYVARGLCGEVLWVDYAEASGDGPATGGLRLRVWAD